MEDLSNIEKKYSFDDLCKVMDRLLGDQGCPWDKIQTHETLKEFLLEECYEVIDAINHNDNEAIVEELGDVLLQVVFHGKLGEQEQRFDINDITNSITQKMINRHRHIFAENMNLTPDEVLDSWEIIKKEEKGFLNHTETLTSVPKTLPALVRTYKIQKKASKLFMNFEDYNDSLAKISEELVELNDALEQKTTNILDKYGDLLFSVVNISRFLKINPEFALTNAIEKFINRFAYIENTSLSRGERLEDLSKEEFDRLWIQSKDR